MHGLGGFMRREIVEITLEGIPQRYLLGVNDPESIRPKHLDPLVGTLFCLVFVLSFTVMVLLIALVFLLFEVVPALEALVY